MLWFNENRSCIEIVYQPYNHSISHLFNENRSCIEMISHKAYKKGGKSLMKTEVVLK